MDNHRRLDGRVVLTVLIVCGTGGWGCGGGASGFVGAYCDLLKPCCAAAGFRADGQQCRLLFGAFGTGNYNATAGDMCLAELRAMSDAARCASNMNTGSCSMVFPSSGSSAPGATCNSDSDCASSPDGHVICAFAFSGNASIYKCQVQINGQEGSSPCVGTIDSSGMTRTSSSSGDVVPRGYLCDNAAGLRCQDGGGCVRLTPVGGSCTSQFSAECVSDARCDNSTQSCVTRKPLGAACTGATDECVATAYCGTALTCTARLAIGATCTGTSFDECLSGNCTNGTCRAGLDSLGLALLCGS